MKKYILFLFVGLVCSCSQKEIKPYEDNSFLAFKNSFIDTTSQSFLFFYENGNKPAFIEQPVVVKVIGPIPTTDLTFDISVDKKVTDCPENLYEMPSSYTFRKGHLLDTFYIKLKYSPEMVNKAYTIAIEVKDTKDLLYPGRNYGRNIITISDMAERPKWWTLMYDANNEFVMNSIEGVYLGKYSRLKYELFMNVTGVISLENMSSGEKRRHSIIFKNWLSVQDPKIKDPDNNEEMSVPVIGG